MANPTSGFQLSKLPEPLSIPTNIGVVDVGQMQKAYSNAMQNVQDTALFGQRVAAQKAALDYQEQLARQQSRLLSPQEQALIAGYRAEELAKQNIGIAEGARQPYIAPTAQAAAGTGLAEARTGQIGAETKLGVAAPIAQAGALADLYRAQAGRRYQERRATGPLTVTEQVPLGNTGRTATVIVNPEGGATTLGAAVVGAQLKSPSGYYTRYINPETDNAGNQFAYQQIVKEDQLGNLIPFGQPNRVALTGDIAPFVQSGQLVPMDAPQPAVGAQAPTALAVAPAPDSGTATRAPLAASTPRGPMALGSFSAMPVNQPPAALAANRPAAAAPAPVVAPVDPRIQPSPFVPSAGAPSATAAPEAAETQKVRLPWLRNREVDFDSPLGLTDLEFRELAARKTPSAMTPRLSQSVEDFSKEVSGASQALQQKTDALGRLAVSAKRIEEEGIGTGAWQKYVPQDLLQLLGDPSKQDFNSAVNELVNKLSEDTRFRNFAVVDLIRSTKPEQSDDPSVVTSKIDYLAKGLARWQDAMAAANHGIKLGLTPIQIRGAINSNFLDTPYEEYARQNPASPISRPNAAPNTVGTGPDLSRAPSGIKSKEELMKALGLTIAPNN